MGEASRSELVFREIQLCAACGSINLHLVFDFGNVPLAGYFPKPEEDVIPLLPMKLLFCKNCTLYQITPDISDDYLFRDYRYVSSIGMQSHFNELAEWFVETQKPDAGCRILELGCNDGPLLHALTERGFAPVGIDPAGNIVNIARKKGFKVINDFFNMSAYNKYEEMRNLDFIFSSNSFAHISNIRSIVEAAEKCLAPGGRFIIEVQSLEQMYENGAFDFVYHEHKYYYSVVSMSNLMAQFNLHLVECIKINAHGGSLRFVFRKSRQDSEPLVIASHPKSGSAPVTPELLALAIREYSAALAELDLRVQSEHSNGNVVAAFGASGRANMLLGKLPLTRNALKFVVDESPERIGREMAQNGVKIVGFDDLVNQKVDVIIILAWNFAEAIVSKLPKKNYRVLIPLPNFKEFTH